MTRDDRIDAYIEDRSLPFARPILKRIRTAMHAAHDEIDEDIKWGSPAFLWNGRTLAIMASFKAHAALSFSRDKEFDLESLGLQDRAGEAMGRLGRIESVDDLPDDATIRLLVQASQPWRRKRTRRPSRRRSISQRG